jgi:hypothetical protein
VERSGRLSDGGKQTCRHRNANTLDHLDSVSAFVLLGGPLISLDLIIFKKKGEGKTRTNVTLTKRQ